MTGIPVVQILYAELQDTEDKAERLDPNRPHREDEINVERAVRLCGELSEHFRQRGDRWQMKLDEYRERATWGE